MKKKFLYCLMTLIFAVALCSGSVAILSTDSAMRYANAEGEDASISQSADAFGVSYSNATYIKQTLNASNQAIYTVSYSGAQQWIDLPAGQYTLQAWGGSGGGATPSTMGSGTNNNTYNATYQSYANTYGNTTWNTTGSRGGAGGFVQGTMTLTSTTRLYLYVGGAGLYGTGKVASAGGWNGGASGSTSANGGGGGASDIRIGGTTVNHRVLVAGGGGGSDNLGGSRGGVDDGSGGAGGGDNGERARIDGAFGGSYPTQSGGYNFGNGQVPTTATDTGGGGGGWYGGYATNHNQGGASGGSSYVLTSSSYRPSGYAHGTVSQYNMTGKLSYGGIWNGNGKLAVTMLNAPPTTKNTTITSVARGSNSSAIAPTTIAQDTDGYKTMTWAETNKIYYDAACTSPVPSSVLTVSGMTQNQAGGFVINPKQYFAVRDFYVKVKDNFPLTGNIKFRFGVVDNAPTAKSGVNAFAIGSTGYEYRVGTSNSTDVASAANDGVIYNPSANAYTVVIPKPIALSANSLYIEAKNLFNDVDMTNGFDDLVITSVANPETTTYRIELSSADRLYGRGYSRLRVYSTGAASTNSGYVKTTIKVAAVEKTTNAVMGAEQTIDFVFKVDNTRPKMMLDDDISSSAANKGNELMINTYVGANSLRIDLEQLCYDNDRNTNSIINVKVPTNEFIYLDKYGNNLYTKLGTSSNYYFTPDVNDVKADSLSTSAEGTKALNFEKNSIVAASGDTSQAYMSYSIDSAGQFITLTPLRATRNQYTETTGRSGHFYFMIQIRDNGEPTDNGIWYPVAVQISNSQPTQPTAVAYADSSKASGNVMYFSPMGLGALDIGDVGNDSMQVSGIAADKDVYSYFVQNASQQGVESTYVYNEFLLFDKAQFGSSNKIENEFYIIEPVTLYASAYTAAKLSGGKITAPAGVTDMGWGRYDEWGEDIKISNASNVVIEFIGIKVTFKRSTQGMYIQQPIVVKDTRGEDNSATSATNEGTLDGLVNLLIKVSNNNVTANGDDSINKTVVGVREYIDVDTGVKSGKAITDISVAVNGNRVEYVVPNNTKFEITPYDIASDLDLADGWITTGASNTNPNKKLASISDIGVYNYEDSAAFTEQLAKTKQPLSYFYTSDLLTLSTQAAEIKLDELTFDGLPQVYNSNAGNVKLNSENNRLTVETTARTSTGNAMYFTLKVSDGKSSTINIDVYVTVTNNRPEVRTNATNVFYLTSNFNGLAGDSTNSSDDFSFDDYNGSGDLYATGYNVREIKPVDLAFDNEDKVLAFTPNTDFTFYTMKDGKLEVFADGALYVDAAFKQAEGNRSGQVLKIVAKSCTQKIAGGLFIGVNITDNYGKDVALNSSEIVFQVEVTNSKPVVNQDVNTGFMSENGNEYAWKISPNDATEIKATKYLVSNQGVYDHLTQAAADKVAAKNIRLIAADNDTQQRLSLFTANEGSSAGVPNIPLYGVDSDKLNNNDTDVAVRFTPATNDENPKLGEFLKMVSIVFFDDNYNPLPSPYKTEITDIAADSFKIATKLSGLDADRYKDCVNWAITINTGASFAAPMKFTLNVRDTADTSRADESGYNGKRENGAYQIDGCSTLKFSVDIGTTGMKITHNVYTENDNKYFTYDENNNKVYSEFRYDGITVASSSAVSVPMSYFAFPNTLPTEVVEGKYDFGVSFNGIPVKENIVDEDQIIAIYEKISLTDGTTVWSGGPKSKNPLNNNPFVKIEVVTTGTVATWTTDYYNGGLQNSSQSETVSTVLNESFFGLSIKSHGPRSGASPLKLSLDLAMYTGYTTKTPTISLYEGKEITAKVSVDLNILNNTFDISGGAVYDTDVAIPKNNISAYSFKLTDGSNLVSDGSMLYVKYSDGNRLTQAQLADMGLTNVAEQEQYLAKYRDSLRFNMASMGLNGSLGLTTAQISHMVDTLGLSNTSSANTIKDIADYLNVAYTSSESTSDIAANILALTDSELAGINPNAKYSDYFTVDSANDSDTFTIRPIKKTTFDYTSAPGYDASKTDVDNYAAVKAAAQLKGLDVDLTSSGYKIYYPFKVLVYDTYANSGFAYSTWQLLTVKVRINNTAPTVNSALYTSGSSYFNLGISMEENYTMSIANVINDRDMKLVTKNGETYYLTKAEIDAGGALDPSDLNYVDPDTTDYLVFDNEYRDVRFLNDGSKKTTGYANYAANYSSSDGKYNFGGYISSADSVIDVSIDSDLKKIVFSANKKVKTKTFVSIYFQDNNGEIVAFNVLVTVNNQAPELLKKRVDGNKTNELFYDTSASTITMKTGDYFDLVVTPFDFFTKAETVSVSDKQEQAFSKATTSYGKLQNFVSNSTDISGQYYLGAYVVAEDDSCETLRFTSISTSALRGKLEVTEQNKYDFTGSGGYAPLTYRIRAVGTCTNQTLKFTVKDDENMTLTLNLVITVQSTPPSVITDDAKVPFERETSASSADATPEEIAAGLVFKINMKVGDTAIGVSPSALCSDPDSGDTANMYFYRAFSGSCFSIGGNTTGVTSSAYVNLQTREDSDGKIRNFTITATNFISGNDKDFEQIVFYVMDPSGQTLNDAQKIIINVYIQPNELENKGMNGDKSEIVDFEVKSKVDYEDDKTPSSLTVVNSGTARAVSGGIIDNDYGSDLTKYNISVYAMLDLETDENGNITKVVPLSYTEFKKKNIVAGGYSFTPYELKRYNEDVVEIADIQNSTLYDYVSQYFEFDFSIDGSTINFIPANVTIEGEIPLLIELSKRGIAGNTDKYTAEALYAIDVDNSTPFAITDNKANNGYFDKSEKFLTFSGYVGSTRTYDLQNVDTADLGLFSDYDTNDSIVYDNKAVGGSLGYEILTSYDYGEGVVTTDPRYKSDSIKGLAEAISVTSEKGGSQITIKFNRKVDAGETDGQDMIRLPLKVYAKDNSGAQASTVIILQIMNSAPELKEVDEETAKSKGLPYTVVKDGEDYLLEMSVEKGSDKRIKMEDIWSDLDITAGKKGNDTINFWGSGEEYLSDIDKKPGSTHLVKDSNNNVLFKITTSANNEWLNVESVTYNRGQSGIARLIIRDSAKAETKILTIKLTVANSKTTVLSDKERIINILGSNTATEENNTLKTEEFNILDFVFDNNSADMTRWNSTIDDQDDRSYIRISSVVLDENANILMHPEIAEGDDTVYSYVASAGKGEEDPQSFFIKPQVGVYGSQSIILTIVDDGNNIYSADALTQTVEIVINVVRNLKDIPIVTTEVKEGKSQEVVISDLLTEDGKNFSNGYGLHELKLERDSDASRLEVFSKEDDNGVKSWFVKGKTLTEGEEYITVKAVCYILGKDNSQPSSDDLMETTFYVKVRENSSPVKLSKFTDSDPFAFYASAEVNGTIHVKAYDLFEDIDTPDDALVFVSVECKASSILSANLDKANNELLLKFNANRPVTMTVSVTDETGRSYTENFYVFCPDKGDLGLFSSIVLYITQNPMFFLVVAGIVLLLIIILLIIIFTVRKKKKMRKEIEALLVSEMELEEQMLKLSASPNPTYYQSYGYLPPTQQIQNNPSFMLGQGTDINTNSAIGLNPGDNTATGNTITPNTNDPNNGFDDENF